tara:strand:- start:192 stop:362 length:171 start_codon:yes stop_codon:yes gene_type:complete
VVVEGHINQVPLQRLLVMVAQAVADHQVIQVVELAILHPLALLKVITEEMALVITV